VAPGATPQALFVGPSEFGKGIGNAATCTAKNAENLTAPPAGVLCVYVPELSAKFINITTPEIEIISSCNEAPFCTYGTLVTFKVEGTKTEREETPGHIRAIGFWAITAP
jgi:hypothetical protein